VDDLLALREAGFGERLSAFDGPIVGLCGGYQMLGERLENAAVEGTGETETVEGFGHLPVVTRFSAEKRVEQTTVAVSGTGPIAGANGTATGYEIHAGRTETVGEVARPLGPESAARGDTLGTYLHGLFENRSVREAFVDGLYRRTGRERPSAVETRADPCDRAAALCREAPGLVDYLERLS
jgi:adenosylcobyric acid synthase